MKIAVILASTRPNYRLGERVAKWMMNETKKFTQAEYAFLDLRNYDLPFFNEAEGPRGNKDRHPAENVKKWLDDLASADGYVFITPEYNHAPPASIKNALDFIAFEVKRKPAAIIAYTDGSNGGANATFLLRTFFIPHQLIAIPNEQVILNADKVLSEEGVVQEDSKERMEKRFSTLMQNLIWYTTALKTARET